MESEAIKNLKETDIWTLYEKCKSYCNMINMFQDTDKNYRFYNGDQWQGLKIKGIEPVQLNFIKPIVKYKVGTINSNLYTANFSSENIERQEMRKEYQKICEMLNKKVSKIWEKDGLDYKIREVSKDSAINDEGLMYVNYDKENQTPTNEVLSKNDVFYGNENDSNIQNQSYILIKQRLPVIKVQEIALDKGVPKERLNDIVDDQMYFEEAGEQAKLEKDGNCILLTKMYKKDGTVHFEQATRYCQIKEDTDTGLTLYPISHFPWEKKIGSARGEGEVRHLISNQIEVNKTLMRRLITVKKTAYPQKIVNPDKIMNPAGADNVGGTLYVKNGQTVDDVNRVFGIVQPAQMSADVEKLQNDLISVTRELAGAGDIATGDINPETASGKAILAVQQASQQPLTEQQAGLKLFLEDLVRIYLDMYITYSTEGLTLEEITTDPQTGEENVQLVKIPQEVLRELKASVKIDITPKGAFDKYAHELTLENLLKGGYFNIQRLAETKVYVKLLPDDAAAPKMLLEEAIQLMEEEQQKIAQINAQAQLMQQRANQFLSNEPESQQAQIMEAEQSLNNQVVQDAG